MSDVGEETDMAEEPDSTLAPGRTRDALADYFRMRMKLDGGQGWQDGYLDGFEDAITLVDFLVCLAGMDDADGKDILIELRAQLQSLNQRRSERSFVR